MKYKRLNITGADNITDVDGKTMTVKGYFSIFGNIDADDDMIMPGAYRKTIQENKRIKHLYQHDIQMPLSSVRGGLKVWEDNKGLAFESSITNTSWGRDVMKLYEDKVIDEHSVGIYVVKFNGRDKYREVTEVMMMEGSTVTWGANEDARGEVAKSINVQKLVKSLKNTNFENEDVYDLLEIYIKQLESKEPGNSTRKPENSTLKNSVMTGIQSFITELQKNGK